VKEHKPRIAFLTKYSRLGASSRYRTYQYLGYLEQQAVEVCVSPLLDDEYLERLYGNRGVSKLYLLKAFCRRLFDILKARNCDLIVIEKELFPYMPALFEHLLHSINKNIVTDYDDAIFANYQNNLLLKSKIPTVMKLSKAVNVGNRYLADYARSFNQNVSIIPTAVDLSKYVVKDTYEIAGDKVVIGWIGTPITSKYLFLVQEALAKLSQQYHLVLRCIGTSSDFALQGVEVENMQWNESTEASRISTFDVGIMPLSDDLFSRGKCGLKLIQYMACGVPSVASPVGVNKDIICDGESGLLAGSEEEWIDKMALLIKDQHLRERMGMKGRQTVIERYSLEAVAPRLLEVYEGVVEGGR